MNKQRARVVEVLVGTAADLARSAAQDSIDAELDGIVGDRHRSFDRRTWSGDKQPEGTRRRNERQWSAVSSEEMSEISEAMNLTDPLTAGELGVNLCLEGVRELSRLPKGTLLRFPSGAVLQVEEYNPPCHAMGKAIANSRWTRDGTRPSSTAFSKAAKLKRGLVGVVEASGSIRAGDDVEIEIYEPPPWLRRTTE